MWGRGGEWRKQASAPGRTYGHLSMLGSCLPAKAAYPPAETSHLHAPVYLALQLIGCAASPVSREAGGLLPRLFTLTWRRAQALRQAVVFCHIVPGVAARFPLESMMLFVARTFLLPLSATGDRPHFCIITFYQLFKFSTFVVVALKPTLPVDLTFSPDRGQTIGCGHYQKNTGGYKSP